MQARAARGDEHHGRRVHTLGSTSSGRVEQEAGVPVGDLATEARARVGQHGEVSGRLGAGATGWTTRTGAVATTGAGANTGAGVRGALAG